MLRSSFARVRTSDTPGAAETFPSAADLAGEPDRCLLVERLAFEAEGDPVASPEQHIAREPRRRGRECVDVARARDPVSVPRSNDLRALDLRRRPDQLRRERARRTEAQLAQEDGLWDGEHRRDHVPEL